MDDAFAELVDAGVDVRRACGLVGRPRSTHYWRARPRPVVARQRVPRQAPANALSVPERDRVLALLRDPAFVGKSPAQVWARSARSATRTRSARGVAAPGSGRSTRDRVLQHLGSDRDAEAVADRVYNPDSWSFYQGRSGGWRERFTECNLARFAEQFGDILAQYGYE